jgi:hypothetical protein
VAKTWPAFRGLCRESDRADSEVSRTEWLGGWAVNLMLINVSTRKLRRAVWMPEGDLPIIAGDGGGLAPVRGTVGRTAGRVDDV